jgi:hypothetical protein
MMKITQRRLHVPSRNTPPAASSPSSSSLSSISRYYLAHMNYARLRAPYHDPIMAEFQLALGPINDIAKSTPGYVWSLDEFAQEERDKVPILRDDPLMMPQLSLWDDVDCVQHFAFKSGHAMYLKRKREWFTPPPELPYAVCWWFQHQPSEGKLYPTLVQAFDRCKHLREYGPLEHAFDFKTAKQFPKPSSLAKES